MPNLISNPNSNSSPIQFLYRSLNHLPPYWAVFLPGHISLAPFPSWAATVSWPITPAALALSLSLLAAPAPPSLPSKFHHRLRFLHAARRGRSEGRRRHPRVTPPVAATALPPLAAKLCTAFLATLPSSSMVPAACSQNPDAGRATAPPRHPPPRLPSPPSPGSIHPLKPRHLPSFSPSFHPNRAVLAIRPRSARLRLIVLAHRASRWECRCDHGATADASSPSLALLLAKAGTDCFRTDGRPPQRLFISVALRIFRGPTTSFRLLASWPPLRVTRSSPPLAASVPMLDRRRGSPWSRVVPP
jgi:hypothetical protein